MTASNWDDVGESLLKVADQLNLLTLNTTLYKPLDWYVDQMVRLVEMDVSARLLWDALPHKDRPIPSSDGLVAVGRFRGVSYSEVLLEVSRDFRNMVPKVDDVGLATFADAIEARAVVVENTRLHFIREKSIHDRLMAAQDGQKRTNSKRPRKISKNVLLVQFAKKKRAEGWKNEKIATEWRALHEELCTAERVRKALAAADKSGQPN